MSHPPPSNNDHERRRAQTEPGIRRTKLKTGCTTCRVRKVKCDEFKPVCKRCASTGRACDGYQSPFRYFGSPPGHATRASGIESGACLRPIWPPLEETAVRDVDLLQRCFSTKTLFDVKLGCDEEARQVLQAISTDEPLRHAVLSLRALREDLETFGDGPASLVQQTPSRKYGLEQYSMALGGLASKLSSPGSRALRSALLCCQVFISIEQVRKNYAAMGQHIIRGLRIMHEYRARPDLVAAHGVLPAHHGRLPLLDVFIIKLFLAPCRFAEPPPTADVAGTSAISPRQHAGESRRLRVIAPDMRAQLVDIAASTLGFLVEVSQVESVGTALRLRAEKAALLESLESWLRGLELAQTGMGPAVPEPIPVSFSRFFHQILKIALLGALDSSPNLHVKLRTESERLQSIANCVGERVRGCITCSGTRSWQFGGPENLRANKGR